MNKHNQVDGDFCLEQIREHINTINKTEKMVQLALHLKNIEAKNKQLEIILHFLSDTYNCVKDEEEDFMGEDYY